jgi:hypothetical protein
MTPEELQRLSDEMWDKLREDVGCHEILPGVLAPLHIAKIEPRGHL